MDEYDSNLTAIVEQFKKSYGINKLTFLTTPEVNLKFLNACSRMDRIWVYDVNHVNVLELVQSEFVGISASALDLLNSRMNTLETQLKEFERPRNTGAQKIN